MPVCMVVLSSSTFIFSYLIAVLRHDVDVLLPYISDTANNPPESCFFGLMTFISACTGIATIYAMYKYMARLGQYTGLVSACCNRAALGLGLLSCVSMCVVATFQASDCCKRRLKQCSGQSRTIVTSTHYLFHTI